MQLAPSNLFICLHVAKDGLHVAKDGISNNRNELNIATFFTSSEVNAKSMCVCVCVCALSNQHEIRSVTPEPSSQKRFCFRECRAVAKLPGELWLTLGSHCCFCLW